MSRSALEARWIALSRRERVLIVLMLALAGGILLWLAVWRPFEAARADAEQRLATAISTNRAIGEDLATLRSLPVRNVGRQRVDEALVRETADAAGLTLDRLDRGPDGRLSLAIGSVRSGAFLGWIAGLEARGVQVESVEMTPGATPATLTVQAQLRLGGPS